MAPVAVAIEYSEESIAYSIAKFAWANVVFILVLFVRICCVQREFRSFYIDMLCNNAYDVQKIERHDSL